MATQDNFIKTALRLPKDLHARIQLAAEQAGRSMNAEIIDRLNKSVELDAATDESLMRMAKALEKAISALEKNDLDAILKRRDPP